ncbi:H(+)/Cl(-) exchange transporter 7-like [Macrosteles quadrilineatus]|uniref:H(+)/Cl(-) exchange transporter 7-like n=1 Tax=Macrosteles quadrilineatus TaxID=74068 RepID=UPI0023E26AED|nr:H(+)/Cl(-) exchange transporter 7-like [Macrosteles quadrilineatus]
MSLGVPSLAAERNQSIVVEVIEFKDEKIPIGTPNILKRSYESLDYDECENDLLVNEAQRKGYPWEIRKKISRWFICLIVGLLTALIGVGIDISIQYLAKIKYTKLKEYLDACSDVDCMYTPYLFWLASNLVAVLPGAVLVAYVEPIAMGSGIPHVKCYLNGIKMPHIVRLRTLVVKVVGVVSAVVGGLACGKEGPMIHSGAVVAAGISQGKSYFLKFLNMHSFAKFRDDREKRDFVSGGAAAGVAAAFGAPVGGVLFALEEGASFWNQGLTWRIFFASSVSAFTLNACMSWYEDHPGNMSYDGLLNFGSFDDLNYHMPELIIFVVMGAIGGLLGAFYNFANHKLTVFRMRYIRSRWLKVLEVLLVSGVSCTLAIFMVYGMEQCVDIGDNPTPYPIQMHCDDGEYNSLASLWIQLPETTVRSFFHDSSGTHAIGTLLPFVIVYYFVSIWTYGISVSAGLFIPCLLVGGAWGRMIGIGLQANFPYAPILANPGKYALIGAAAQLGGVVRMTISLTVILIEATGSIIFGLPLMITLLTAKWVGDFFNEGLYDLHIQLSGVPLLAWDPPPLSFILNAREFMSSPVTTLQPVESVRRIVHILRTKTYNGFPVVDPCVSSADSVRSFGRLKGLILRSQLIVMLQNKIFNVNTDGWDNSRINMSMFRKLYPRFPTIEDIALTDEEMNRSLDLRPFMNPSPYCVQMISSMQRVFRLFRALGLRHVVVTNETNEVVGIVTRKDLTKYRVWKHFGQCGVKELKIV